MPRGVYTRQEAETRFWRLVNKTDDCWLWTGCVVRRYGGFQVNGRLVRAHRFSWTLHFGVIPDGLLVCHTCDNPLCVKPGHLFVGTVKDNADDREKKGRGNPQRGTRHGHAKLTEDEVRELRQLRRSFRISYQKLGVMFGVSTMQAWSAAKGISYKDVK